jgi:hypothetical protein
MPKREFFIETVAAFQSEIPSHSGDRVFLNCPAHIFEAFKDIIKDTPILGATYFNPYTQEEQIIPEDINDITPLHLQIIARNEEVNVDGRMATHLYQGLLTDNQIASIRCLVKSTTVSGTVFATHTGGYREIRSRFETPIQNILIDQAGLQWQSDFRNTGGLHFYPEDPHHPALPRDYIHWQNAMYLKMYGVERAKDICENSLRVNWLGVRGYIDLNSVQNALAIEFSQALDAAVFQSEQDLEPNARVNFRFNRAGMGFFISGIEGNKSLIRVARLKGIAMVLEKIQELSPEEKLRKLGKISRIVLPHSNESPYSDGILEYIGMLVESLGLQWGGAPEEDSFHPETGLVNVTTNCADPHAMPGNEGGPSSVDACISYNANINHHNAAYNKLMQVRFSPSFTLSDEPILSVSSSHSLFTPAKENDDSTGCRSYCLC